MRRVAESSEEELTEQIEANLNSVVRGCHAVLPHMRERKQGLIINMGSIASTRHFPHFAAYTAAKWG
jgi:NADP-dependent 3-hydroxy acid dehydrogenase YdfG